MTTREQTTIIVHAALALERMAFVIAEPIDVDPGATAAGCSYCAVVGMGGDGFVIVAATEEFVQEVAAGMLGVEPEDVVLDEHGEVTALELANVLGGHVLHEVGGDTTQLRLHLPQAVAPVDAAAKVEAARARGGFAGVIAAERGRLVLAGAMPS